jgi:hypothetical protein
MSDPMTIACTCGQTRLEIDGAPILVAECLCNSCRTAGARLATLPGAKSPLVPRGPHGATPYALYRKDRVRIASGNETLAELRLSPKAGTRRVVATCCNTPLSLDFQGGHWLSLYLHLWPIAARPKADLRTMTGDLADPSTLPTDIPNLKSQSLSFFAKLLVAWIAMGFRAPKFEVAKKLDV